MGAARKSRRGRGRPATSVRRGATPRGTPERHQLDLLYRTAPVGLCLLDRELRYVRINERLAEINGRPVEAHIGRRVRDVIPDLAEKVEPILRRVLATGKPELDVEVQGAKAADPDRMRTWLASYHPVSSGSGEVDGISIAVQEVTELRRAEEALTQRLQFETLLTDLSATFVSLAEDQVDQAILDGLQRLVEFLGIDRGTLLEFSEERTVLRVTHSYAVPGFAPVPPGPVEDLLPWYAAAIRRGELVRLSGRKGLPAQAVREREYTRRENIKASLSIPLSVGGVLAGAIALTSFRAEWDWPDALIPRLRLVGELFASAIARRRAKEALAERLRFETLLSRMSAALINPPAGDIGREIERWLQDIVESLEIDRSTLAQFSHDDDDFHITHSWARPGFAPVPPLIPREALPWIRQKMLKGEVVTFSRLDDLPPEGWRDKETMRRIGPKSSVFIPLAVAGSIIGAIGFGSLRRERSWAEDLVQRLRLVAQTFANALQRQRAEEEVGGLLRFERLRSHLSARCVNLPAAEVDREIGQGLQRIGEFLGVDRATLSEFSAHDRTFRITHWWGRHGVEPPSPVLSPEHFPWVSERVLRGEIVCFARPADLPGEARLDREAYRRLGISSHVLVPLGAGGSPVGAISVSTLGAGRSWDDALVQRLRLVGEIFANALVRQRADAVLRESEARFRQMADTSPVMVWMAGTDKRCTYFNRRWLEFTGRTMEQELGDGWSEGVHPDDLQRCLDAYVAAFDARREFSMEYRLRLHDGTYRWIWDMGVPRFELDGRFAGYIGSCMDIAERKRAEAVLRRSEERFRILLETTRAIAWEADATTWQFTYVGPQAAALLGHPLEDWSTKDFWTAHLHPEDREAAISFCLEQSRTSTDYAFEYRMVAADGSPVWIHDIVSVERVDGQPRTLRGFMIDISERKRLEEQFQRQREELAHVARLATMGELAAALAHELNQPLGAILSNAEAAELLLAADPPALDEVRAIAADIAKDDRRAGEVIRRMRGLLRKGELELQPQDLNDLIRDVARLASAEAHIRRVDLVLHLHPDLPPVRGDRVHLQQVVLNLMLNGMEAMGKLPPAERTLIVRTQKVSAQTVEVAVEDQGVGIAADGVTRIFEPFYTTKPGGMGMGLSIVRTIVEAHGGRVWAENNPGRGATVRFFLSACEAGAA